MWKRWRRRPAGTSYTISSTNSTWMHCWDIVFWISRLFSLLTCDYSMYALVWLLMSITVYNKLAGPTFVYVFHDGPVFESPGLIVRPPPLHPHSCQPTLYINNDKSLNYFSDGRTIHFFSYQTKSLSLNNTDFLHGTTSNAGGGGTGGRSQGE